MGDKFDQVDILGVKIDKVNLDQAVGLVEEWLKEKNPKKYIVTPNPEFILTAQGDEEFKKILNNADLSIPDGSRLGWAAKMLAEKNFFKRLLIFPFFLLPAKVVMQFDVVAGVDLMEALCKEAAEKGFTVGLLGGQNAVAEKAADRLRKKYQNLKITFTAAGGDIDRSGEKTGDTEVQVMQCDILFVAYGQVKQEKWIDKNLDKIPVKVAMGVGGAFDYISGNVMRAPEAVRAIGLEWLFRLILQPWRILRQLKLINFLILVVASK